VRKGQRHATLFSFPIVVATIVELRKSSMPGCSVDDKADLAHALRGTFQLYVAYVPPR